MQIFERGVIGDHSGVLAIDVMMPLFKCNNNSQELTVMCGVVALGPSELLAKVGHRLQATTLILLYGATNAVCRHVCVDGDVPTHIRNDHYRGGGECRLEGLKGLLISGAPLPWYT